jgi:twitching motility protein PilT
MLGAMESWGASDLFVHAGRHPAVRLHGQVVPLEVPPTPAEELERFVTRALPEHKLADFRRAGDLDAGFSLPDGKRFRLNLARQLGQLSLVARVLAHGNLGFEELGLPPVLGTWAERPRGLILVTGATGAGKSTTMAAMVHHINQTRAAHVITIEDPVEFLHADQRARVTQREVGTDTLSFDVALRQALRESPDVIFIGELRSPETMRVALQAALTGHLVLSTLHTVDVAQTLQRALGLFPEEQAQQVAVDLSLALVGVAAQRLVPRADGHGRVVAVERLSLTPGAARLIREQRVEDLEDHLRTTDGPDAVSFDQALLELSQSGAIDLDTALAHASHPEELSLAARGMSTRTRQRTQPGAAAAGLSIEGLLSTMEQLGASDLHLSVGQPPTLRINGRLLAAEGAEPLTAEDVRLLLHSIMSVRQRSVYEIERELDFSLGLDEGRRYRVNAYFERGHMAAALRAIPSQIPLAEKLGLPKQLLQLGAQPQGLLLVAGPTGAGKTTTLACLIDRINNSRACHVMTIEDPIEYVHISRRAVVHQREVGADTKGFAAALRHILRQDPDVVLIGELRDLETISAALTAAETGHLVLATLHTNDAIQTIDRIIDVFPPHQQPQVRSQLAASLLGVVSQRLLPRADGTGRVAAFEVMVANSAIRTLVRENKMHQALGIMQAARGGGMMTMDASIEGLIKSRLVDKDEAMRYMLNPASAERRQRPG